MTSLKPLFSLTVRFHAARAIKVLCLGIGVFLICVPLFSQGNQGRITGTITDQSGGVIAGASVTITDVQRGVSRTLITVESGEYNAPNLLQFASTRLRPFMSFTISAVHLVSTRPLYRHRNESLEHELLDSSPILDF